MRTLGWLLILTLLAGCVPSYKYAPDRYAFSNVADAQATFEWQLKQCGGAARTYPVPLIALPLFVGAELALRESVRRCMEANGWRVVDEPLPPPLSSQEDLSVDGTAGNPPPRQVGESPQ